MFSHEKKRKIKTMAKFQVAAVKKEEVKVTPALPKATITSEIAELDGVQGLVVKAFYPFPDDSQLEIVERKGRKDSNKDEVVSSRTTIGRAASVPLTMEQEGIEVALVDGNGNQLLHTSKLFTNVKGPGADDEGEED